MEGGEENNRIDKEMIILLIFLMNKYFLSKIFINVNILINNTSRKRKMKKIF